MPYIHRFKPQAIVAGAAYLGGNRSRFVSEHNQVRDVLSIAPNAEDPLYDLVTYTTRGCDPTTTVTCYRKVFARWAVRKLEE